MTAAPAAVLWDVDGTLAETERDGHRVAFNLAFETEGLAWRWDPERYGELLRVAGGRERLLFDMETRPDAPRSARDRLALVERLHQRKTAHYTALVRQGAIGLRDGVRPLLQECRAHGVTLGIATTTTRANIEALLSTQLGSDWPRWFAVIVAGEDVRHKKPDPEVYHLALAELGISPGEALALEDSPDGARAALAAGVPVVVTRSAYFSEAPPAGVAAEGPGLQVRAGWTPAPERSSTATGIGFEDLRRWWAAATTPQEK
ncbi:MAG: HAD-IA family hydrolase [Gemmatimonadales bacterium]